jgi:hypothetical protein
MKALVIVFVLVSPAVFAKSVKTPVKKVENKVKTVATPGPCVSPTADVLKELEKPKQEIKLQGAKDTGCKLQ